MLNFFLWNCKCKKKNGIQVIQRSVKDKRCCRENRICVSSPSWPQARTTPVILPVKRLFLWRSSVGAVFSFSSLKKHSIVRSARADNDLTESSHFFSPRTVIFWNRVNINAKTHNLNSLEHFFLCSGCTRDL